MCHPAGTAAWISPSFCKAQPALSLAQALVDSNVVSAMPESAVFKIGPLI